MAENSRTTKWRREKYVKENNLERLDIYFEPAGEQPSATKGKELFIASKVRVLSRREKREKRKKRENREKKKTGWKRPLTV